MLVAIIAVVVATTGTAFAATGQLVNIVDPSNAARAAKVDAAGKLNVGDGSGSLTVDGTTTGPESAPNTLFRSVMFPGPTCAPLATPPTNKALIIKSVALDTIGIDSPGGGKFAALYVGANGCDFQNLVMEINPPGVGLLNQPFEPGLAIPAGQKLWIHAFNISSEASAYGYSVAASAVPAASASVQAPAKPRDLQR
jgi:hypothetical protein